MIAILLFLIFSVSQEQKIVTCTYNESNKSALCVLDRSDKKMSGVVFFTEDLDLTEWRLTAPMQGEGVNSDAPLFETPLVDGQKVKAIIDGNKLAPIASCRVRVWRNLKDFTNNHPGEPPPFGRRTEPDDCQPLYPK